MKKIMTATLSVLMALSMLFCFAACGAGETISKKQEAIDTFNETVGRTQNIRVQVGSVTNMYVIVEKQMQATKVIRP